jgi:hypothetical protein
MSKSEWPAWYSSPDGSETDIFHSADKVPAGWTSGAEKRKPGKTKKADEAAAEEPLDL